MTVTGGGKMENSQMQTYIQATQTIQIFNKTIIEPQQQTKLRQKCKEKLNCSYFLYNNPG